MSMKTCIFVEYMKVSLCFCKSEPATLSFLRSKDSLFLLMFLDDCWNDPIMRSSTVRSTSTSYTTLAGNSHHHLHHNMLTSRSVDSSNTAEYYSRSPSVSSQTNLWSSKKSVQMLRKWQFLIKKQVFRFKCLYSK